jgi:hypothetical protein
MAQLTHAQYDALERAVMDGTRIAITRSGRRELIFVPLSLKLREGREVIEARNPATGYDLTIYVDEIEAFEVVR